jgi:Rrf2 family protein
MKIPARIRYAVRILLELGKNRQEPLPLHLIEKSQQVSSKFAKQILQPLERAGLVEGRRGRGGGYFLQVAPEKVTLMDIFQAMGEKIHPAPCLETEGLCPREDYCGAKDIWGALEKILAAYFRQTTIRDLINREKTVVRE